MAAPAEAVHPKKKTMLVVAAAVVAADNRGTSGFGFEEQFFSAPNRRILYPNPSYQ